MINKLHKIENIQIIKTMQNFKHKCQILNIPVKRQW
jgi:hypothetical protein